MGAGDDAVDSVWGVNGGRGKMKQEEVRQAKEVKCGVGSVARVDVAYYHKERRG